MPAYDVELNLRMTVHVRVDGDEQAAREEAYKLLEHIENGFQERDPAHFVSGTGCTEFSISRAGGLVEVERAADLEDHEGEQFR